ncbi:MAG: hypothetical protein LUQ11_06065 [Methylococcaceae bacterium]|nr:hypothetical protein [Methylococcaceae bacterium]
MKEESDTPNFSGKITEPPDFREGVPEYKRNLLVTFSLAIVLNLSTHLEPQILGVKVSVPVMWCFLGTAHIYFFVMWRLTSFIESDKEKKFWNLHGLVRQAFIRGTSEFPSKTRAQIIFLRALPIWVFLVGIFAIIFGLFQSLSCSTNV